jgi:hypothetical protein
MSEFAATHENTAQANKVRNLPQSLQEELRVFL